MKIIIDEYTTIVFFNEFYAKNINFKDKEELEDQFRKLFLKLKDFYNIKLKGYYDIEVFVDQNYGAIIELTEEDLEYFDYLDNQIDMRVNVLDQQSFLYQVDDVLDIPKEIISKTKGFSYHQKFYLQITEKIEPYILGKLLENSRIIYGEEAEIIKKCSKKLNFEDTICKNMI